MKKYKIEYSLAFDLIDSREMTIESNSEAQAEEKAISKICDKFDVSDINEISINYIKEIK